MSFGSVEIDLEGAAHVEQDVLQAIEDVHRDRLLALIDEVRSNWLSGVAPDLVLVDSMDDPRVPEAARRANEAQSRSGATGAPKAFVAADTVYLVAQANTSKADALASIAHETVGHWGLRRFYADRLDSVLDLVIQRNLKQVAAKAREYGLDTSDLAQLREAAEEVLAEIAEEGRDPTLAEQLEAAQRAALRELVPSMRDEPFSRAELLVNFLAPVREHLKTGSSARAAKAQERTKAFRDWFADSKVVNDLGAPLVVYHGTRRDFSEFRPSDSGNFGAGIYFADAKAASEYGDIVMPVYLRISNPMLVQASYLVGEQHEVDSPSIPLIQAVLGPNAGAAIQALGDGWMPDRTVSEQILARGHDGLIATYEDGSREFVVFRPEQVKSAIGNRGTFDPANPDIQFRREGEAAFDRWFQQSKVVDASGKPMVVYHGTFSDFSTFEQTEDIGFHFGSIEAANKRIEHWMGDEKVLPEDANIQPVYLSLQNPLRLPDLHTWSSNAVSGALLEAGVLTPEEEQEFAQYNDREMVAEALARKGYDGIVYRNETEGGGDSWIVFDAWRIKSAIGNRGTFDRKSEDVRFKREADSPQAFEKWFSGSKVVDAEGRPLVAFHGTAADFTEFDPSRAGTQKYADWGEGAYFTLSPGTADYYREEAVKQADPESARLYEQLQALERQTTWSNGTPTYAEGYYELLERWRAQRASAGAAGGTVMPVYLAIRNPYIVEYQSMPDPSVSSQAKARGHDGIFVLRGDGSIDEIVAFRPEQIKSAIGNRGTFDASSPDIRFRRKSPTERASFKRWFSKSQVVDEQGKPRIVYHGTNQVLDSFDPGRHGQNTRAASSIAFFFTESPEEAAEYAMLAGRTQVADAVNVEKRVEQLRLQVERAEAQGDWPKAEKLYLEMEEADLGALRADDSGQNILPVYLSVQRPKVLDMDGSFDGHTVRQAIEEALAQGHDGLKLVNAYDPVEARSDAFTTTQWVVFRPEQIKSATGNRGTYDSANPDIRFRRDAGQPPGREENLRRWIGDSKVVDETGKPRVMYHSTVADFSAFRTRPGDIGMHFGTQGQAQDRFALKLQRDPWGPLLRGVTHATMPVYLKVTNPLRLKDLGSWDKTSLAMALSERFPTDKARIEGMRSVAQMRAYLQSLGYDGIVYRNTGETQGGEEYRRRSDDAWAALYRHFDKTAFSPEEQKHPLYVAYKRAYEEYREFRERNAEDSYIVFRPHQVKSAIGNRGTYETSNPDIRFRRDGQDSDIFHSEIFERVYASGMKSAPPAAWSDFIRGLTRKGVSEEEVNWSGVLDWLDAREQVGRSLTKNEVLRFLDENVVRISETILGGRSAPRELERLIVRADAMGYTFDRRRFEDGDEYFGREIAFTRRSDAVVFLYDGDGFSVEEGPPDANEPPGELLVVAESIDELGEQERDGYSEDGTRYPEFTLAGGQNYREVLLTLREHKVSGDPYHVVRDTVLMPALKRVGLPHAEDVLRRATLGMPDAQAQAAVYAKALHDAGEGHALERYRESFKVNEQIEARRRRTFHSNHWMHDNVLLHIRLTEREDESGARVLFVEEIQSDWAQQGKRAGFRKTPWQLRELRPGSPEAIQALADGSAGSMVHAVDDGFGRQLVQSIEPAGPDYSGNRHLLPPAPFVQSTDAWVGLALKRIVKLAVDEGFDKVAFVTGDQSVERYGLSKAVASIDYIPLGDGRFNATAFLQGGGQLHLGHKTPEEFASTIGKDLASKIAAGDGVKDPRRGTTVLITPGLQIGGEGMRAFYDRIVPMVAKSLLKQLGGPQLGQVRFVAEEEPWGVFDATDDENEGLLSRHATRAEAEQEAERHDGGVRVDLVADPGDQLGFDVTPALRERVRKGLGLFSIGDARVQRAAEIWRDLTDQERLQVESRLRQRQGDDQPQELPQRMRA